ADPRVRRAMFLALDRRRLVEELQEGLSGGVTTQPWAPTSPAFDQSLESPFYDPDKASALLREAGFTQAKTLHPDSYPGVVQQNLARVGIRVEIRLTDIPSYSSTFQKTEFPDLFLGTQSFGDLLPLTALQQAFVFQVPNPSHYKSQDYLDIVSSLEGLDPNG